MRPRERMKQIMTRSLPGSVVRRQQTRRVIMSFAEKIGFVYFGYVNQKDDEHKLVRGVTLSPTHLDSNYCIGTFRGYDTVIVTRRDSVRLLNSKQRDTRWVIMSFDLHTSKDIPHILLCHGSRMEVYLAKYSQLVRLALGVFGPHHPVFSEHYSLLGSPGQLVEIERIFRPELTALLPQYLPNMSLEVDENVLYVYAHIHHPTEKQLESILTGGAWLAEMIDRQIAAIA